MSAPSRRSVLAAAAGILASVGFQNSAHAEGTHAGAHAEGDLAGQKFALTVLGTTDLHGNVFNWDYYANREFDDAQHNDIGLAKISTLVNAIREQKGRQVTLLIDAGDTIQGTPLAYYYAKIEPITGGGIHPMAAAMNAIGYNAAAIGNHEFNYGIPILRAFEQQLKFPLLAANALDKDTGRNAFKPYTIKKIWRPGGPPLLVGILGLTNPGIALWDKANVEDEMTFPGLVEQAKIWVPRMRAAGTDIVIVAAHSGADLSSSYGDQLPYPENCAALVAEKVPGIDAILVGHAHVEIPQRFVTNRATGKQVLLTEPLFWGKRLSVLEFDFVYDNGWQLAASRSQVLNSATVPEDEHIVQLLRGDHDKVISYVNSKIGTCTAAMSAAKAPFEDTAALDFINHVQAEQIKKVSELPVLSLCAPFNRAAAIPAGDVSIRDIAGLYIFDNYLLGVKLTGAQLKDVLEKSATYFARVTDPGPYPPAALANGVPDYNFDIASGLDAPLTYDIDISRPVGERVVRLNYGGVPVTAGQEFAVAVNNYRQSGGGNFPHIAQAPVLHNQQQEIRQLLIDWVKAKGVVDPATFHTVSWRLVADDVPVVVSA